MSQVTEILGDKEFYGEIIEGVTRLYGKLVRAVQNASPDYPRV